MEQLGELYYKYSFAGAIRYYKKKLTLIGENVIYLGESIKYKDHWVDLEEEKKFHCYKVDGIIRYFTEQKEISWFDLSGRKEVVYCGIKIKSNPIIQKARLSLLRKYNKKCCYCGDQLTQATFSREHITPKHLKGKIVRAACKDCNQEKGPMLLSQYIQFLNSKLMNLPGKEFARLQTKINNANKIAIQLRHEQHI